MLNLKVASIIEGCLEIEVGEEEDVAEEVEAMVANVEAREEEEDMAEEEAAMVAVVVNVVAMVVVNVEAREEEGMVEEVAVMVVVVVVNSNITKVANHSILVDKEMVADAEDSKSTMTKWTILQDNIQRKRFNFGCIQGIYFGRKNEFENVLY